MKTLSIHRTHAVGKTQCIETANDLITKLKNKYGGDCQHSGDDILYKHPTGLTASISPKDDALTIDVKFTMLTLPLKSTIEQEVNKVCDEHLCS